MRNVTRYIRNLLLAAAIGVFLAIVLGGMARAAGVAGACQGWPLCRGNWLPPADFQALVDNLHWLATILVLPLLLAAAGMTWIYEPRERSVRAFVSGALVMAVVQILLGAVVDRQSDRAWLTAIHLAISLFILAFLIVPLVVVGHRKQGTHGQAGDAETPRFAIRTPFARLSLATLAAVFALLVSGVVVSGTETGAACSSWPLCDGSLLPASPGGWIQMAHRLIVASTGVLVAMVIIQAWRTQRSQTAILVASTSAGVLFFALALMGAYQVFNGFPLFMSSLHQATAVAVWAAMIVQVMAVGLAGRTVEQERQDLDSIAGRKGLGRDLLTLTKPVVVALLLVTTFAGMTIGAQDWPSLGLVFWTLLGGAMAAGGSGAINQYIDRFDDTRMQRTEKRPIPAGRLTPGEGLAFGVGLSLASFYLMVAFVNLLAALLALAGIIYYVLIYSIFLKKITVQNIVIGGGAGAIPPLVGWAAATGGLNIPALFLFALVFMWTPPHFWALAIVRRNDYARAGVPMLPVVRGEKEARWQIFLYTIELVVLTLLLPLFGLGSSLYLVSAAALGGWLLFSAWKVWTKGGNKTAWKMYRYSSMYLAFLFLALMVDRLIF